jgi:uncharacterized protein YutE (UPF0331/DUF86 family)/predicted nucleotidyltransferase
MGRVEEKLAKVFEGQRGIIAVYLFGSQARGDADKFSDFDLAALFEGGDEGDRRDIIGDLLCKVFSVVGQDRADVVDISDQPLWFQRVIVKTGKVIYESDRGKRLCYERRLMERCREAGLDEYMEDGGMKRQDVQINLDTIDENLRMLEVLSRLSYDEFMSEFWYLHSAVRLLQTSIEALIDISRYVIRSVGLPRAEELWQVPKILADSGYIEEEDADVYIRMVRFRNLVVHHYYKVDPEEVYGILKDRLKDIRGWRDRLVEIIESDKGHPMNRGDEG